MMKSKTQVRSARRFIRDIRKQAGMTLMEIIAALAIIAAVVVGALALFNSAQSSNQSVSMLKDLIAVRAGIQQLYIGHGGYGAVSLDATLVNAGKVPSDLVVTGTAAVPIITTPFGGVLTVTGATTVFTISITKVPSDICSQLVSNASTGWSKAVVGTTTVAATATAFPVSPVTVGTACGVPGTLSTIAWTTAS